MTDAADRLYERILVVRAQAGDEAAFAELVGRYSLRLRYFLRKMLGHAQAAEDVLQEVWFDVFRSLPRLVDAAAFPAWLYRIARNRACGELRKANRAQRPLVDGDLTAEGDGGEDFSAE